MRKQYLFFLHLYCITVYMMPAYRTLRKSKLTGKDIFVPQKQLSGGLALLQLCLRVMPWRQ